MMRGILYDIEAALIGTHCRLCGKHTPAEWPYFCPYCWTKMSRFIKKSSVIDRMSQPFVMDNAFVDSTSMFVYAQKSEVAKLIHDIKYHGCQNMGRMAGRLAAEELSRQTALQDIDAVVPVPIHWIRKIRRGYNQAEAIARGVADVLKVPVINALYVPHYRISQTHKSGRERMANAAGKFAYREGSLQHADHILIVDDVFTTGATMYAAVDALKTGPWVKYSIMTLSITS